jgi:hypothetical protein
MVLVTLSDVVLRITIHKPIVGIFELVQFGLSSPRFKDSNQLTKKTCNKYHYPVLLMGFVPCFSKINGAPLGGHFQSLFSKTGFRQECGNTRQ